MTSVVISQPFLFPWVGLFEQIRLADVFVHYDDVQFSQGGFSNRVQIKTTAGPRWLTVPLQNRQLRQRIKEVQLDERQQWRHRHLTLLQYALAGAPYQHEALAIVHRVYERSFNNLAELVIASVESIVDYFSLRGTRTFAVSSALPISGRSSQRVLDLVRHFGGTRYVTGHGAKNYLDHAAFEAQGVAVEYMHYQCRPYPQLHGPFTPFVSALDLIANLGPQGTQMIDSGTIPWQTFLAAQSVSDSTTAGAA